MAKGKKDKFLDSLVDIAVRSTHLFLAVWIVMLSLGAAHSHDARIPALGFATVGWLVVAVSWLASYVVNTAKKVE